MCPNGCNGNGVCDTTTGICDCYPQFQLEDCSLGMNLCDSVIYIFSVSSLTSMSCLNTEVTPMMDSTPYQGTSSPAAFVYYLLNVPNNVNTITITFALKVPSMNSSVVASPEGHYWTTSIYTLFVAQGYYPDLSRYDYVARVPYGAPSSTYDLTIQNPIPGPTYIGIYGNMLFNFNLYAAYYSTSHLWPKIQFIISQVALQIYARTSVPKMVFACLRLATVNAILDGSMRIVPRVRTYFRLMLALAALLTYFKNRHSVRASW
jgi:hypothetical protein